MKKFALGLLFLSSAVSAEMSQQVADKFLIHNPVKPLVSKNNAYATQAESLAKAMFTGPYELRTTQGMQNYKVLLNYAKTGNPYASYNVGMYMVVHEGKFGFKLTDALLHLKIASDGGVDDAKYALALLYLNRADEISGLIQENSKSRGTGHMLTQVNLNNDAQKLKQISYQYIMELASIGYQKAFLMGCNFYAKGQYLKQDLMNAALCYNNAIKTYNSSEAMGLLAKIYFQDKNFDSREFELKGIELANKASQMGDAYAMALLGKQFIYPKYLPVSDVKTGTALIFGSAESGNELGVTYKRQFFDGSGRLIVRPPKPIKQYAEQAS